MKNRWSTGVPPRHFLWIMKGGLAVSERPGGYGANHRTVRRREEILWIKGAGFTRIVSILPSPHNLHAYDELEMTWSHIPLGDRERPEEVLPDLYKNLDAWIEDDELLLMHSEQFDDSLIGAVAGYMLWLKKVPNPTQAIILGERFLQRQMNSAGRELVKVAGNL